MLRRVLNALDLPLPICVSRETPDVSAMARKRPTPAFIAFPHPTPIGSYRGDHSRKEESDECISSKNHLRTTIRRQQFRDMVPLADSTIYAVEQRGRFPRRFVLSPRCVVWDLAEVEASLQLLHTLDGAGDAVLGGRRFRHPAECGARRRRSRDPRGIQSLRWRPAL